MFKTIRQPATAGQFYPNNAEELKFEVERYLNAAAAKKIKGEIKAIMSPHAGYAFSGFTAAHGYKQLKGKQIDTVIIICNAHAAYFEGIAVDANDIWQTPLGDVPVNKELAEKLVNSDSAIQYNNSAHQNEHALETQLPFLQIVLNNFKIVPVLFGVETEEYPISMPVKLAEILAANLSENDLIVASTDMSHYPAYEYADKIDRETLKKIKTADIKELDKHIQETEKINIPNEKTLLCGIDGIKTTMLLANKFGWKAEILKYANSGDVPIGGRDNVVGYGSAVFIQTQNSKPVNDLLSDRQKQTLLNIAKTAVENYARSGTIPEFNINDNRLNRKEGAFVTLLKDGKLRGCIGQIIPSEKPLWRVIRDMAIAAAMEDNRFAPISPNELNLLDYEISVLSAPEKIDDWRNIELGKHGVIVKRGGRTGVFLPQVAVETGWTKEELLSCLCSQKAGLPPDCYKDNDTEIKIFTAQIIKTNPAAARSDRIIFNKI